MKKLGWITVALVLSLFASTPAIAQDHPNQFLERMRGLLDTASFQTIGGPFAWKEVRAGVPNMGGEVAYFGVSSDTSDPSNNGFFLQLEEWKLRPDGKFLVIYTVTREGRAYRWTWVSGTLITTKEEELKITSPEVIEKSERAQRLLLERGRPVIVGGVDI